MADTEPELYNYEQFAERFPTPKFPKETWAQMLLRFRKKNLLVEGRGYKLKYYGHMRYMYSVPAVVRVICTEARKEDRPLPTAMFLYETYYDQFCTILTDALEAKKALSKQA